MDGSKKTHDSLEGVDRGVPGEDVPAAGPEMVKCPECGLRVPLGTVRCPRCNRFLLTGCSGSCGTCGSRTCARAEVPKER
jgi:hypothetical protein